MNLRIHILGPFQVLHGDAPVPDAAWKTQKNKLLLKILLTFRGRALTKEQLIEWLWPDLDPAAAARNLRVAVSQLRQLLEPDLPRGSYSSYILTTESGYSWNREADYWLDAEEFEQRAARQLQPVPVSQEATAQVQAILGLYRGDYLEEDRYADWAIAERERLRELRFTLLTRFAEASARRGRYLRAIALCCEVLVADRCRESVWCQLMLYHYHAGDQNRALQAYEECRRTLADELDVEPLPETTALAQQIRRREVAGPQAYPPPAAIERLRQLPLSLGRTPFVGREMEYTALVDHLGQATAGRGRVVLVEGEAGVGKTRLAEEVLGFARQQGTIVLEGRCWEDGGRPFQPILAALRFALDPLQPVQMPRSGVSPNFQPTTLAVVAELLPQLRLTFPDLPTIRPLAPEHEKLRLFEALAQLLLAIRTADQQDARTDQSLHPANPLLFFLDDLQWADASTLEFLDYLTDRIPHAPVLILGTVRSEEVAAHTGDALTRLLWTWKRRGVLHRLVLKPLSPAAITRLLEELSGHGSPLGQQLYDETEGNPLFLVSMLQALFEDGLLTVDERGAWSAEPPRLLYETAGLLPARMRQVIRRRLRRLRDEERQVLEAAAVLGREFEWSVLSRMRAWRRDVLLDHLDRLMGTLLIREQSRESYTFSHEKIRQAVYEGIAEEQRGWLHGKAGQAIERVHAEGLDEAAGILAHHFQQAGRSDKAFAYHLRAGRHATGLYANAVAMRHFQAALQLVGAAGIQPPDENVREAHERLGDLYEAAGQYTPAQEQFVVARRYATLPADRVRLLYKLAHIDSRLGHSGTGRDLLRQVVEEVDRLGVDRVGSLEAARAYARWAIFGSGWHGKAEAERYARQAVEILERSCPDALHGTGPMPWDEYDAVHSVLNNAGETFRHWKSWSEAADLYERSLLVAEQQGDPNGIGYSCHNLGDVTLARGDFAGARALYQRAGEAWATAGQTWLQMANYTHLGLAWACEGRWREAMACLQQARTLGEQMDPTEWLAEVYLWLSLVELRCTGDQEQARGHRERAVAVAEAAGQAVYAGAQHLVLSAAAAAAGHLDAAWQHYFKAQVSWEKDTGRAMYSRWILQQCEPAALLDD